jgi:threonine/homoserine/homoserine lactone efflux protein
MLIGALILLGAAVLGTVDDAPRWLYAGLYFVGYVLLAYGFFTAMSARRGGPTPRDRG